MNYREAITIRLENLNKEDLHQLILYPFGEQGRLAKSILEEYFHINPVAIVDNRLSKTEQDILSVDELGNMDLAGIKILLTSDRADIHHELLIRLYEVLPKVEVIELFPDWEDVQERARIRRCETLKKVKRLNLVENAMCYKPPKTDVTFFLPYVYMDFIQSTILLTEDYFERNLLDWVFFKYKNGVVGNALKDENAGVVLDIGANIGNHSLYFIKELGVKKVISFEPVDETFWILEKNVLLNELQDRIELHQLGLSDQCGKAQIGGYNYANIGQTQIEVDVDGQITLAALDDFGFDNVSFIKIDVEGMEVNVLKGALGTIAKSKPYIMVETFDDKFQETNSVLSDMGYQYTALPGDNYLFYIK